MRDRILLTAVLFLALCGALAALLDASAIAFQTVKYLR